MLNFFQNTKKPQSKLGYKAVNQRIGLNEEQVRICTDRDSLLNWRVEIQTDIESMETQMKMFGNDDAEWLKKTTFAHRMNVRLFNVIQMRLLQINKESKASSLLFLEVAEDILPTETFQKVLARTMQIAEEN